MDIRERVYKVLETLNVNQDKISDGATFRTDLQFDSIDIFEFVDSLKEEFEDEGLEIDDKDVYSIVKVSDVIDYLEKKLNE